MVPPLLAECNVQFAKEGFVFAVEEQSNIRWLTSHAVQPPTYHP